MNPKIVWYLAKTDWRRLWPLFVALWILILLAAYPALNGNEETLRSLRIILDWGGGGTSSYEGLLRRGTMSLPWMVLASLSSLLGLVMLTACAMVGINSAGWSRSRPVRGSEVIAAKALAILLCVLLPLVIVVGLNFALHGFGPSVVVWGMARSAMCLAPMLLVHVLFGRLCGSFWKWIGGCLGLLLFLAVFRPTMWSTLTYSVKGEIPPDTIKYGLGSLLDLWGAADDSWIPHLILALVLAGLLGLRGKFRRSFWLVGASWPAVLLICFFPLSRKEEKPQPQVPELAAVKISPEAGSIQLRMKIRRFEPGPPEKLLDLQFYPREIGVPEGWFVDWQSDSDIKVLSRGGTIANFSGKRLERPWLSRWFHGEFPDEGWMEMGMRRETGPCRRRCRSRRAACHPWARPAPIRPCRNGCA